MPQTLIREPPHVTVVVTSVHQGGLGLKMAFKTLGGVSEDVTLDKDWLGNVCMSYFEGIPWGVFDQEKEAQAHFYA